MKIRLPVLTVLLCVSALTPNLRAFPSDLGVTVQSASYDTAKHEINIRFYNSTRHNVTAYSYSVRIDFADGTSRSEDRATELAFNPSYKGFFLLAGTTRDENLYEVPFSAKVTRVVGSVTVAAYDDGTTEVLDEAAFNRLVRDRQTRAVAAQKVAEILKQALSTDNPGQYAASKFQELAKTYTDKGTQKSAQDAAVLAQLHYAASNMGFAQPGMTNHPPTTDRIQKFVEASYERIAALKFHSDLRRLN